MVVFRCYWIWGSMVEYMRGCVDCEEQWVAVWCWARLSLDKSAVCSDRAVSSPLVEDNEGSREASPCWSALHLTHMGLSDIWSEVTAMTQQALLAYSGLAPSYTLDQEGNTNYDLLTCCLGPCQVGQDLTIGHPSSTSSTCWMITQSNQTFYRLHLG